jgi:hypothetical protein
MSATFYTSRCRNNKTEVTSNHLLQCDNMQSGRSNAFRGIYCLHLQDGSPKISNDLPDYTLSYCSHCQISNIAIMDMTMPFITYSTKKCINWLQFTTETVKTLECYLLRTIIMFSSLTVSLIYSNTLLCLTLQIMNTIRNHDTYTD